MKKYTIALLLLTTTIYVKATSNCWSNNSISGNYPCCPEGTPIQYSDDEGDWGVYMDNWCGIVKNIKTTALETTKTNKPAQTSSASSNAVSNKNELETDLCWSMAGGFPCCSPENTNVVYRDQDGKWGLDEDGNWCGMKNSVQLWNDREKNKETKNEWEAFKVKWDKEFKKDFERLSVFPGEDETKLNFGWYSTTKTLPSIRYSVNKDMSDAVQYDGYFEQHYKLNGTQYYSNKVTIEDLKPNTVYYYQRLLNGEWEKPVIKLKTRDPYNFKFVFVGDPQIGGSHDRFSITNNYERVLTLNEGNRNDAFNWNRTISRSFEFANKPSLLLSAGDQADEECKHLEDNEKGPMELLNEEMQYSAFLLPDLLKSVPVAAAVGNHDASNNNFRKHFNSPNSYTDPKYQDLIPGYNYFFRHHNVLVVVLETNYGYCEDFSNVIEKAIKKYPDVDWRIAMFHHDIYGNGVTHSKEPYIVNELRPCLTQLFYENKFDLVINGHDHVYTASKFISYDNNNYSVSDIKKNKVYKQPKGTFYITANCSTGSKLYDYYKEDLDYVYQNSQTFSATFGILDFKVEDGITKLSIASYDVETYEIIDGPYYFEKTAQCWSKRLGK
ncbi:Metallo-dependent phosphatase [Piromyces finnis]|uniref:Purple acid phosphatase n=1 Tax=Piromyces finnis TaxID=1754191 RepID=A0A1Y1VM23_9FUNG|nr:Metallo-dependent phosphatase [Piromyces finnis]|eukprot:ORX59195.1 Metallo-dependent phosphatase [Piromyces finnis]